MMSPISHLRVAIIIATISALNAAASAQVGGPNRRLETPTGFGSATVVFTRAGGLNTVLSTDKPTFYLGISAPIHIDAGAQYEPVPTRSTGGNIFRKGWGLAVNMSSNPAFGYQGWMEHIGDAAGHAVLDPAMGRRQITFRALANGDMNVTMTGFAPINGNAGLNLNTNTMRVKRVIGVTQALTTPPSVNLDGAYMLGTTANVLFTQHWVTVGGVTRLQNYVAAGPNRTRWPSGSTITNLSNPQGRNDDNFRPFTIDLPRPWNRTAVGNDRPEFYRNPSRLDIETVDVDLRPTAELVAKWELTSRIQGELAAITMGAR